MPIKLKSFFTFLSLFMLFACDAPNDDVWIVGTSADNPPYEYMEKGQIKGFDVDLMNEIGARLDKQIKFKNTDFHGLLAALASRHVDLVIAGMSITEERKNKVDFSEPYTKAQIVFLVRSEDEINDISKLQGKKVGSQLGTIWSNIAYELGMQHHFKNKTLANNLLLVEELKVGRIDAVIMEKFQVNKFIERGKIFSSFKVDHDSEFSIALPKNSPLTKQVNEAIRKMKKDGTIKALQEKWRLI